MINSVKRKAILKAVGRLQKKHKSKKFVCLYEGCTEYAIMSHSQQKEGQLRTIAENGLVYSVDKNVYLKFKLLTPNPLPEFRKVGIKEASTFPGYCSNHDKSLFRDIELFELTQHSDKQAFFFLKSNFFRIYPKIEDELFSYRISR